ncbi:MAG: amidohydrolase family protein [Saprospiraceae bacterium]|nr:amidohydrolase family protein [Saprospiraceae bacterium]
MAAPVHSSNPISAVNEESIPSGMDTLAIVHANIITGDGSTVIQDGCIIIEGPRIKQVGRYPDVTIPKSAKILEAEGLTIVPGLIDAHFHLGTLDSLPSIMLARGITSLRDPGAWIESYDRELASDRLLPRFYLTGPHFDMFPPAYPTNSFILRDASEARSAVHKFSDQGASAIKIYFRSSLAIIQAICETADERGIPATAHLEITDIYDAVDAGIDGIEHITSVGSNLVPDTVAEAYKQAILRDNNARRIGRYSMWQEIDPDGEAARRLAQYLADEGVFVCPTLGAFEYQPVEDVFDSLRYEGFGSMLRYTKVLFDMGVPIVVGSHSWVQYAAYGWAYHNEMELFAKSGISPLKIIKAATYDNARFFRIEDNLGSLAAGKQADLILVKGDPSADIRALRDPEGVMLQGRWIKAMDSRQSQ